MLLISAVILGGMAPALNVSALKPPPLELKFFSEMHIAGGYGHDGDGCELANTQLIQNPVISEVWFDAAGQRLAQTNPGLQNPNPLPNLTVIGRYDLDPPTEIDINDNFGTIECQTEPLPPAICRNGSRVCPPTFGGFGSLNAFTSILGMFYPNTTLLETTRDTEIWQWKSVILTKIPVNGTILQINVTRNYTYTLSSQRVGEQTGPRRLLRFQWTQSIPLRPDTPQHPVHRDCFIFDYSHRWNRSIDADRWNAPPRVTCQRSKSMRAKSSRDRPRSIMLASTQGSEYLTRQ